MILKMSQNKNRKQLVSGGSPNGNRPTQKQVDEAYLRMRKNTTSDRKKPGPKVVKVIDHKQVSRNIVQLPHCSMDYLSSILAPFDTAEGVCIPAGIFPIPSQKTRTYLKGKFYLGTTGQGYIILNPTTANDGQVVISTGATSAGTNLTALNAFTNLVGGTMPALPYTAAQLGSGAVAARIVSFGIRIKYIGKLAERNGIVHIVEDPDHLSFQTSTGQEIAGLQYSEPRRIGPDMWDAEVHYSGPVKPSEIEFTSSTAPLGSDFVVLYCDGVAGDSYEFEIVQFTEFVGSALPTRTPSHAEPLSFAKVVQSSKSSTADGPLTPEKTKTTFAKFMSSMRNGANVIMSGGKAVVAGLSGDIPSGLMSALQAGQAASQLVLELKNGSAEWSQQRNGHQRLNGPKVREIGLGNEDRVVVKRPTIQEID